jgi:hypothetical protein
MERSTQITTQLCSDAGALKSALGPRLAEGRIDAVVLLALGVEAGALVPFAVAAGNAPVLLADCYGVLGYSTEQGRNLELMEQGRGREYGGAGGDGGQGVVAVLFHGEGRFVASTEQLPAGACAHMVVTTGGGTVSLLDNAAAPYYGGVAKAALRFDAEAGSFTPVERFFVTTLARPGSGVGTGSFTSDPEGAVRTLLETVPEGGTVEAIALFPCFMRGKNTYGTNDVEPDAVNRLAPGVPVFGMFCHGELGPCGCLGFSPGAGPEVCSQHSMTTIVAVHAVLPGQ